jgi:hypothetical protein|tara:strand:+ start:1483 stop:1698 length:216 start_codon:yes stop_codon:yes gene_type:complete
MCVGRGPKTPSVDPAIKAQQEADRAKALEEKKGAKQEALEETVKSMRKGSGRRSLISGSGGGVGFYNRFNQ